MQNSGSFITKFEAGFETTCPDHLSLGSIHVLFEMALDQISQLVEWLDQDFGIVGGSPLSVCQRELFYQYNFE
jgi:hypothetical protein